MIEEWIEPYYATRKTSRRGKLSVEYELHFERNLARLVSHLENQTYKPSTYAFMTFRPRQREVFACEMSLRIIDTRLYMKIGQYIEKRLTDRTFNNRIGYGNVKAINSLISDIYEVSEGHTKDAWIIKVDMQGFFPNAIHQVAYEKMKAILDEDYDRGDKDELQKLLMVSAFTDATNNCTRLSPITLWEDYPTYKSLFTRPNGIGGVIGRQWWQVAMNLYLNDLDHKAIEEWGLHWNRFVDDIAIVADNKEMVLALIPKMREELEKVGVKMHPKKFYCQHYTRGVEFIGAFIKSKRVYAKNKTIHNAELAVFYWNKRIAIKNIEAFLSSVNSYLGILKGRNEHNNIIRLIAMIDKRWFKFCSYNKERVCLQTKSGYKHHQILERKYNIKLKNNGNKRTNRKVRGNEVGVIC